LVVHLFGIELVRIMKESQMAEQEPKKGQMTVEEAGRKGGETVRDERGSEFYSEIGHKGGQRVRELIEEGKQSEEDQRGSKG
jgi:general stress protein YciG